MIQLQKWRMAGAVLTFLFSLQIASLAVAGGKAWSHKLAEAQAEAIQLDRPVVLHFHASWCNPCRQMDGDVLSTGEVKRVLSERIVGVKIDLDEHPEIAAAYGVETIPADVILSPQGRKLAQSVGYQNRPQYIQMLLKAESDYQRSKPTPVPPPVPQPTPKPVPPPIDPEEKKLILPPSTDRELIVGLDGFCPVTLWRTRQWVKGNTRFGADFQGVRFYFTSRQERDEFILKPSQYAPQLLGCDPVVLWDKERAIAGTPTYAAFFDGELFLFASTASRARFRADPPQFTRTRHVKLEDIERNDTRLGMKN